MPTTPAWALPGVGTVAFLAEVGIWNQHRHSAGGIHYHYWASLDFRQANHIPATNLIRSKTAWYKDSRVSLCLGTEISSGCPYSTAPEEVLDDRDFLSLK